MSAINVERTMQRQPGVTADCTVTRDVKRCRSDRCGNQRGRRPAGHGLLPSATRGNGHWRTATARRLVCAASAGEAVGLLSARPQLRPRAHGHRAGGVALVRSKTAACANGPRGIAADRLAPTPITRLARW